MNLCATEASSEWLKYGRLKRLAEAGDEEAKKECERLDNSQMFTVEEFEEDK